MCDRYLFLADELWIELRTSKDNNEVQQHQILSLELYQMCSLLSGHRKGLKTNVPVAYIHIHVCGFYSILQIPINVTLLTI